MSRNMSERGRPQGRGRGGGWGHGRGGAFSGRGGGMLHQGPLRVNTRPSPYKIAKSFSRAKDFLWRPDLFDDSMVASGYTRSEMGTKLYISNLDYRVSNEDIKELFSEIGDLQRFAVHYDRNGRPTGSAEVVYARRSDAMAAFKRYNNVHLDGKPMKIEEIGTTIGLPTTRVNVVGGTAGRGKRTVVMTSKLGQGGPSSLNQVSGWNRGPFLQQGRGWGRGRGRGRGWGWGRGQGWGRGRGRGRKQAIEKSADELDKELEKYHAGEMDTS